MYKTIPIFKAKSFYEEYLDYDYETGKSKNGKEINDFLDIMWDSNTDMAVSIYDKPNNMTFLGFSYYPQRTGEAIEHIKKPEGKDIWIEVNKIFLLLDIC